MRLHAIRVCFLIFGSLKRKLNEKQWYMTYVILLLLYIIVVSSLIKKARIPEKIEKQKKEKTKRQKEKELRNRDEFVFMFMLLLMSCRLL